MDRLMKSTSVVALLFFTLSCHAATYKCKDAAGNWSESACKGRAAPPPKQIKTNPFEWKPSIGMRKSEVEAAVAAAENADRDKWEYVPGGWLGYGWPEANITTTAFGVREQWVFGSPNRPKYLYIDNGIVTAIQE